MYGIAKRTVLLLLVANIWSHRYYNIEKYRYKFKENGKSPGELRSKPSAGKPLGWGGVDIKKEGIKPSPFSLGSVRDAIFTNQAAETASLVQF